MDGFGANFGRGAGHTHAIVSMKTSKFVSACYPVLLLECQSIELKIATYSASYDVYFQRYFWLR